jgi:hypothetical protein
MVNLCRLLDLVAIKMHQKGLYCVTCFPLTCKRRLYSYVAAHLQRNPVLLSLKPVRCLHVWTFKRKMFVISYFVQMAFDVTSWYLCCKWHIIYAPPQICERNWEHLVEWELIRKMKGLRGNQSQCHFSTINLTWTDLELNRGHWGVKQY